MSTLSIVTITVIAAFLVIFLIAAIAALVYVYITVRKQLTAQIASLSLTATGIGARFDSSQTKLELLIANVHGDKIEKAAQVLLGVVPQISKACTRIEQSLTTFRQTLEVLQSEREIPDSALDRARQSGLLPGSYAPAQPGEHYVSRSRVAAEDAIAFAEESADNTSDSGTNLDSTTHSIPTFGDQ